MGLYFLLAILFAATWIVRGLMRKMKRKSPSPDAHHNIIYIAHKIAAVFHEHFHMLMIRWSMPISIWISRASSPSWDQQASPSPSPPPRPRTWNNLELGPPSAPSASCIRFCLSPPTGRPNFRFRFRGSATPCSWCRWMLFWW